jgi:uncharacterized protein (TIGR00369 family)
MGLKMTAAEVMAFLDEVFPQVREDFRIDRLDANAVTMRLLTAERHLRPGGTVSGPSMFSLADVAVYVMVLGMIGPRELAVTTNCSIDFMRKPEAGVDLVAQGRLLKLGRLLAVGEVLIYSDGAPDPVARASATYAIPPER